MAAFDIPSSGIFPPELIDSIVDHNHSDRDTLEACSLVARSWTPASRFHLFSSVVMTHGKAPQFIQLLTSHHCTFVTAVRQIDAHFVSGSQRWFDEFSRRLSSLDQTIITSLKISGSRLTTFREEARLATINFYPNLRSLSLGTMTFETLAEFGSLVSSFHALEALLCASAFRTTHIPPQGIQLAPPLRHLDLTSPAIRPVLLLFDFPNGILSGITSLSLCFITNEDMIQLTEFLTKPNATLQSLKVTTDSALSGVNSDAFTASFDLTRLTALRELHIETKPCLPPLQALAVLDRITSPNIGVVKVSTSLTTGIAGLDVLLTSPRFAALKKVVILDASWADASQCMPRCHSSGVLQEF